MRTETSVSHISTNDWGILKGERIRRWPSEVGGKRGISVTISTWRGISIGARHWYVSVKEEDNQWWCEDQNAWVTIYDDSERKGYSLNADVITQAEAISVAKMFTKIIAGKNRENHCVSWEGPGKPKWATL